MKIRRTCLLISLLAMPAMSFAFCQLSNSTLQQQCLNQEAAQQRAQQQTAQAHAQLQAQQQQVQQRALQESQERAREQETQQAQQRAQQRAPQPTGHGTAQDTHAVQEASGVSSSGAIRASGVGTSAHSQSTGSTGSSESTPSSTVAGRDAQRSGFRGGNSPLPSGTVTRGSDGRSTIATADGRHYGISANGTVTTFRTKSQSAYFFPNGQARAVHTPTVDITRNPHGQRITLVRRADHTVLVSYGARSGYLERPLSYRGHQYLQRTYVVGGRTFTRNYAAYYFGGFTYYNYVPAYYYSPRYYSWLSAKWNAPVAYAWDWQTASWYAYGGPYFVASPVYLSPAAWMTDYYLGSLMQAAYLAQLDEHQTASFDVGEAPPSGDPGEIYAAVPTPITPDIKRQITAEIQDQVSTERVAVDHPEEVGSQAGLPAALQPGHIFVVDEPLSVVTDQEQSCSLSAGDVLELVTPPDAALNPTALLKIAASHQADCPMMTDVTLPLNNLQEMYNSFRAQVAAGEQALSERSSNSALPTPPPVGAQPVGAPTANAGNVAAMISDAEAQGNQTEASLTAAAYSQ